MKFESAHLAERVTGNEGIQQGERIKRISVSQQIQDSLRSRIISLELHPGMSLSRGELASHYGVSQTPVRDAMMKLEEEGLLIIYPQSKTEVSKIDVGHARETQFLRLSLELEITRRLALANKPDIVAPARKIQKMQENALSENDLDMFETLDRQFHLSLFQSAGVNTLYALVASRSGHIDRLRKLNLPDPGKTASIMKYHGLILDAIERGDLPAVEDAVRAHLSGTLEQVDQIVAQHPDFF